VRNGPEKVPTVVPRGAEIGAEIGAVQFASICIALHQFALKQPRLTRDLVTPSTQRNPVKDGVSGGIRWEFIQLVKRRDRDSLTAYMPLFAVCSNDLSCNDLQRCHDALRFYHFRFRGQVRATKMLQNFLE